MLKYKIYDTRYLKVYILLSLLSGEGGVGGKGEERGGVNITSKFHTLEDASSR
jgi:hypothetical protein